MCAGPDPAGRSRLDRGSTAPRCCATVQSPDAPSRTEMLGWMNHHTCCRARSGTSISAPVRLRLAGTDTWATVSALATGFGTLVLAVATFAAVISRFLMRPGREDARLLSVIHHWNVDRPDPR